MNVTDFVPHGMIAAFAGIVAYVFKEHTKRDDARFDRIATSLDTLAAGQTQMAKNVADNHAEVLRLFIDAGQHAATNAAIAEATATRNSPRD